MQITITLPDDFLSVVIGPKFSDSEAYAGECDGVNAAFILAHAPNPPDSLILLHTAGTPFTVGIDFTLEADTVTFNHDKIPRADDLLDPHFRY